MKKLDSPKRFLGRMTLRMVAVILVGLLITKIVVDWPAARAWPKAMWNWATCHAIATTISTIVIFYLGAFWYSLACSGGHDNWWYKISQPVSSFGKYIREYINDKARQALRRQKNVGRIGMLLAIVLFIANILPLANHFGGLKILFITLGLVIILIADYQLMGWLTNTFKPTKFSIFVITLSLLGVTYYLDCFIFSWDRPMISLAFFSLVIAAIVAILIIKRIQKIQFKNQELQRLEVAKTKKLQDEERRKADKVNLETRLEQLKNLGMYAALLSYFKSAEEGAYQTQYPVNAVLEILVELVKEGQELSDDEKERLLNKIHHLAFNIDSRVLTLLSMIYEDDLEAIMLTHTAKPVVNELPLLFRHSNQKKELIVQLTKEKINEAKFFNEIKKEFRLPEYSQVLNALIFSYKKEWDDQNLLVDTKATILELLKLGVSSLNELWNQKAAQELRGFLRSLEQEFREQGIQIKFPEIPELKKQN